MATDTLASADLETVTLTNGLTCEMPADSPLARLLKSQPYFLRVTGVRADGTSEILSDYPFKVVK